jgi:hypothetical protein
MSYDSETKKGNVVLLSTQILKTVIGSAVVGEDPDENGRSDLDNAILMLEHLAELRPFDYFQRIEETI